MATMFYNPLMQSEELILLIATRLANIRKLENLTQQQLADKAYVSLYTVQRFEKTGECSFLNLVKIARALQCMEEFDKLFKYSDKYLPSYTYDGERKLMKQIKKQRIRPTKKDENPTEPW